jgi:hypothetical protein
MHLDLELDREFAPVRLSARWKLHMVEYISASEVTLELPLASEATPRQEALFFLSFSSYVRGSSSTPGNDIESPSIKFPDATTVPSASGLRAAAVTKDLIALS